MKLCLITGFLGAGKTCLLKSLLGLLSGQRCYVIVNEFGREGVDGTLLAQSGARLREICSGSIFCACRLDRFEAALAEAVSTAPDVILVEASGFSDPTSIEQILDQPAFRAIEYMGSICVVDATSFHKICRSVNVCRKQVSIGDLVLINKTDLVGPAERRALRALLRDGFPYAELEPTTFGRVQPQWLERLGPRHGAAAAPRLQLRDRALSSQLLRLDPVDGPERLLKFLALFAEHTYRIKGFVTVGGRTHLVDCVGQRLSVAPYPGPVGRTGLLAVLYGSGAPALQAIRQALDFYRDMAHLEGENLL